MLFRYWSDDAPVPPGINRFDLIGHYGRGGKFESYRSQKPVPVGSRFGPQNMVVCGWGLQVLDAHPGLWDRSVDQLCGKDLRVAFLDPGVDYQLVGGPEPGATEPFELGGAKVQLVSHRMALVVSGTFAGDGLVFAVAPGLDGKGPRATLSLNAKEPDKSESRNADGSSLKCEIHVGPKPGEPTRFKVVIPYTVGKDAAAWANGVELGRYSVTVGKETRNFVLASSEKQVRAALERELAGGLRTWEAIFEAKGFIPTGMGAGGDWDKFSDSGGYAHLISAGAQYILWKAGKRDWEAHNVPAVK